MTRSLANSILHGVMGSQPGGDGPTANDRFTLDGVAARPETDGALRIAIDRFEAASLRLASGPLVVEVGRLALHQLTAQVRFGSGGPGLESIDAAMAELADVRIFGPLLAAPARGAVAGERPDSAWSLGPLASANGTLGAQIVDAHLLFDARVTVPIREGRVDFDQASVEHVGPDSRMGVSRLGLYVDAPDGRSYLYQFPAAPVAGVAYEQRAEWVGARVSDRGSLQLQPFVEAFLRPGAGARGPGFTEQARALFDRTSVSGDLRLGDGRFAAPGVQAELVGRAEGRNEIRLQSPAVGRGIRMEIASLAARDAALNAFGRQLACDEVTGAAQLSLFVEQGQMRFALELPKVRISGLHARPRRGDGA